jgi:hypothetical protein
MKFVVLLNIVIPYDWNKFVYHVKHLIIIISQMSFFQGNDHKYVINFLIKNHFEMENDKKFEVSHLF